MTNKENTETPRPEIIIANDEHYRRASRARYEGGTNEEINQEWLEMSDFDHQKMAEIENALVDRLTQFLKERELPSTLAEEIFFLHRLWLQFNWERYTRNAHKRLSNLFLADERFTHYYDEKSGMGATAALCQIIQYYA